MTTTASEKTCFTKKTWTESHHPVLTGIRPTHPDRLKLGPIARKDHAPPQHGQLDLNGVNKMRRRAEQIAFYHN